MSADIEAIRARWGFINSPLANVHTAQRDINALFNALDAANVALSAAKESQFGRSMDAVFAMMAERDAATAERDTLSKMYLERDSKASEVGARCELLWDENTILKARVEELEAALNLAVKGQRALLRFIAQSTRERCGGVCEETGKPCGKCCEQEDIGLCPYDAEPHPKE